jgi:hypothetical protein
VHVHHGSTQAALDTPIFRVIDRGKCLEITSLPLDSVERIIFVPLAKLRRVD